LPDNLLIDDYKIIQIWDLTAKDIKYLEKEIRALIKKPPYFFTRKEFGGPEDYYDGFIHEFNKCRTGYTNAIYSVIESSRELIDSIREKIIENDEQNIDKLLEKEGI
jgi:hypothetical protein